MFFHSANAPKTLPCVNLSHIDVRVFWIFIFESHCFQHLSSSLRPPLLLAYGESHFREPTKRCFMISVSLFIHLDTGKAGKDILKQEVQDLDDWQKVFTANPIFPYDRNWIKQCRCVSHGFVSSFYSLLSNDRYCSAKSHAALWVTMCHCWSWQSCVIKIHNMLMPELHLA